MQNVIKTFDSSNYPANFIVDDILSGNIFRKEFSIRDVTRKVHVALYGSH